MFCILLMPIIYWLIFNDKMEWKLVLPNNVNIIEFSRLSLTSSSANREVGPLSSIVVCISSHLPSVHKVALSYREVTPINYFRLFGIAAPLPPSIAYAWAHQDPPSPHKRLSVRLSPGYSPKSTLTLTKNPQYTHRLSLFFKLFELVQVPLDFAVSDFQ
jgi:hypothetical protein